MHFDHDTSPDQVADWQRAAQQAWGDDTRHPHFVGHPDQSKGQCFVTAQWLASRLGGDVGVKDGHYLWVNKERDHGIDLTNDHKPGFTMIDRLDAPRWKDFRVIKNYSDHPRAKLFANRANAALMAPKSTSISTKTADLMGSDPYSGELPEKIEQMDQLNFHDEPGYEPEDASHEFKFVWANGQLHLSPAHDHEQLLDHAGADPDSEGPTAVGYADVKAGHVTWRVASNVGLQGLRDALAHYSHQVGWDFDGLVGTDGQPMGMDLGPIMSFWYREKDDGIQIAKTPLRNGQRIYVSGSTAWVRTASHPGLVDWAGDLGIALKELPRYNEYHARQDLSDSSAQKTSGAARRQYVEKRTADVEDPEVEPFFPSVDHAIEANQASLAAAGQTNHALLRPDTLAGALARPQQYYNYTGSQRTVNKIVNEASYPGGGNMLDHMRTQENLELFNNGDPNFQPERQNLDEDPGGPFVCPHCAFKPKTFGEYKLHMDSHQPKEDVYEDGHFPPVQDFDEPLGFGTQPGLNSGEGYTTARLRPLVMVLASDHEARRIPEFELYSNLFGFDGCRYYGAYRNGEILGYGVVREGFQPEVMMIQSAVHGQGVGTALLDKIKQHHSSFYSHSDSPAGERLMRRNGMVNVKGQKWVYAKGNEPKDMIEDDIPFVYDIQHDRLELGYAGSHTHDVRSRLVEERVDDATLPKHGIEGQSIQKDGETYVWHDS